MHCSMAVESSVLDGGKETKLECVLDSVLLKNVLNRGKLYKECKDCPPTDPCETPKVNGVGSDVSLITKCERPVTCRLVSVLHLS